VTSIPPCSTCLPQRLIWKCRISLLRTQRGEVGRNNSRNTLPKTLSWQSFRPPRNGPRTRQMFNPTKRAHKAIASLASRHGLTITDSKLNDRTTRIHVLYGGGGHILELLSGVDLTFAQCGSKGEFVAILPAEKLMQLLETDAVCNSQRERKPSNE